MSATRSGMRFLFCIILAAVFLSACQLSDSRRKVVVYTSVDQVYSEPILKGFQERTGVQVLPVFDVEATKTTGLVNRLLAEKDRPQADVLWNGEFAQTILLKERGVLASYLSPNRENIPAPYRDPDGYWTGTAGRARVLIVNTHHLSESEYPESVFDLLDSRWPADKIGMAYPLFGTTATHAAAIYEALSPEKAREFFEALQARGIRIVDGNSVVRDLVADGRLWFGLTDTDDACGAMHQGKSVAIVLPDQSNDALGTLIIPNTVALIAGAPHLAEAKALVDYLLSEEVEGMLIDSGWSHIPLRSVGASQGCLSTSKIKGMEAGLTDIYTRLPLARKELASIFLR